MGLGTSYDNNGLCLHPLLLSSLFLLYYVLMTCFCVCMCVVCVLMYVCIYAYVCMHVCLGGMLPCSWLFGFLSIFVVRSVSVRIAGGLWGLTPPTSSCRPPYLWSKLDPGGRVSTPPPKFC